MTIPLSGPDIGPAEIEAVTQVLQSGALSRGPAVAQFETDLARYLNVPHVTAVSSGTAGLHLCFRTLGFQPGDEVITPSFSFAACVNALVLEGLKPVLVDIDPANWSMDPALAAAAITPRTRGILAVHAFGNPAPMAAYRHIADAHDLILVEDACEALGSTCGDRRAGAWGDAAVFGFYPNKQMTTGEGGAIATTNPSLAARLDCLRNQGRDPMAGWLDQVEAGFNYRLSDLQAALGVAQLARLDAMLAQRRVAAAAYDVRLAAIPGLTLPPRTADPSAMSWFVYVIALPESFTAEDTARVAATLAEHGVQTGRYFAPLHQQPFFQKHFGRLSLPWTEGLARRTLALPFFNRITTAQINKVCQTLADVLAQKA